VWISQRENSGELEHPTRGTSSAPHNRRPDRAGRFRNLVQAINQSDETEVERSVLVLTQSRRGLAPLSFLVGAFAMLFQGLKLLVSNWRLALVEVLPAMWIWFAMVDLKVHALRGRSFNVLRGPVLIPIVLAIALLTAVCFYLNSVFAFSIVEPGTPNISAGFSRARAHWAPILATGLLVGLALGVSSCVFSRWGRWWFAVPMSVVVGVMMFAYVALPGRLVGIRRAKTRRDALWATVIAGAIGAVVCTPPYLLGRFGVLLLGSRSFFAVGVLLLTLGIALQAGTTGAVKAIKMSTKLGTARTASDDDPTVQVETPETLPG
jgi:hypothetical protein